MARYLLLVWEGENERNIDIIPERILHNPGTEGASHFFAVITDDELDGPNRAYFTSSFTGNDVVLSYSRELNERVPEEARCYIGTAILTFDSLTRESLVKATWTGEEMDTYHCTNAKWVNEGEIDFMDQNALEASLENLGI